MKIYRKTISNDELKTMPRGLFDGRVDVVDSPKQLTEACDYLLSCDEIGFDTETKPSFTAGVVNKVALLQLSSHERCYLFRLCRMRFDKSIIKILENGNIRKVGLDVQGDLRALQVLRHFRPDGFTELQHEAAERGIEEMSLRKMSAIVTGLTISKAQRLSNWAAQTLTESQIRYAATDAWICLKIFDELTSKR